MTGLLVVGITAVAWFAAGWWWRGGIAARERREWDSKLARSENERVKLLALCRHQTETMRGLVADAERTMV